ncbi:serine hydrolase domain-containing protein [Terrimonas pollutisoli]|uniref:serine hydrolase domain-containing protein n=1 Tax=Terrimonas pollutisoli TaxID=3034147 RepID=UPI0023EB1A64|nr:serine hydrolase domain-containing protein [Terrimonas sp. H1YJ31]
MSYKFSSICLKSSLIAGFLLLLQTGFAQYNFSDLEQEILANQKILGKDFVVMLWKKDDTLIYKKEIGEFNSKTTAPVASCSKWLTAALVMQFVDEGKLSLDDKISKWIPEFERYGKNYITIRHCLSHFTGIDDEGGFLKKMFQRKKFASLEDEVNSFAAREIRTNPGTDFWYGSIGLNIAGRVLEVISKKKFDVLIKQKLFNPMTMRRTSFTTADASAINPSGGATSTPEDYMKFLVMLMNKGKYAGKQILSEDAVNQLMQVQTKPEQIKYAPKSATGYNYALGSWAIEEKNGKAEALASPGLFGTWPMIDFCRGYAYLVFVKNLLGEERAGLHLNFKTTIDKQFPSACK